MVFVVFFLGELVYTPIIRYTVSSFWLPICCSELWAHWLLLHTWIFKNTTSVSSVSYKRWDPKLPTLFLLCMNNTLLINVCVYNNNNNNKKPSTTSEAEVAWMKSCRPRNNHCRLGFSWYHIQFSVSNKFFLNYKWQRNYLHYAVLFSKQQQQHEFPYWE